MSSIFKYHLITSFIFFLSAPLYAQDAKQLVGLAMSKLPGVNNTRINSNAEANTKAVPKASQKRGQEGPDLNLLTHNEGRATSVAIGNDKMLLNGRVSDNTRSPVQEVSKKVQAGPIGGR